MNYLPIFIDIKQKPCLVVGGGDIAYRKINLLLKANASVTCVSKDCCKLVEQLAIDNKITYIEKEFEATDIRKHFFGLHPVLIISATNNSVLNKQVSALAGEVNTSMPLWVSNKVIDALNDKEKSLNGSKILVLGIAYKKDVDDVRESPSVELMELLQEKGAIISYSDPHVPTFPKMRKHHFELESVTISSESLNRYDLVLIATNHSKFDYELIKRHAKIIVDTRGVYKEASSHIVKA